MKNVVITGSRPEYRPGAGEAVSQRGWQVFAGRYLMELPLLEELKQEYPDTLRWCRWTFPRRKPYRRPRTWSPERWIMSTC